MKRRSGVQRYASKPTLREMLGDVTAMLCEACQAKEAKVHHTQMFGVPPTEWRDHLCEDCATAYQQELERFVQQQSAPVNAGMSKLERQAVYSTMAETMREHLARWKRSRSQQ